MNTWEITEDMLRINEHTGGYRKHTEHKGTYERLRKTCRA